jgi:DNA polymerase-3 subunit gamma/tau
VDHEPLDRRYRPRHFADVIGQKHATAVLRKAAASDRPPQQILLSGGSGLGKTTIARIFAAALLCEDRRDDGDSCGGCPSCVDIFAPGRVHPDVIELDAASNGGKDEIREIAQRALTMPLRGRFKVYIVDEAHGLSRAGAEAALKLLEEPPGHVIFVLATTDPHKMLDTIRGRCVELELTAPARDDLVANLRRVAVGEDWDVDDAVLGVVVDAARDQTGVRGTVKTLAKLADDLAAGEALDAATAADRLGALGDGALDRWAAAVAAADLDAAFDAVTELRSRWSASLVWAAVRDWVGTQLRTAARGDADIAAARWVDVLAGMVTVERPDDAWLTVVTARITRGDLTNPVDVAARLETVTDQARQVLDQLAAGVPAVSRGPTAGPEPDDPLSAPDADAQAVAGARTEREIPAADDTTGGPVDRSDTEPDLSDTTVRWLDDAAPPDDSYDPWFDNPDARDTRPLAESDIPGPTTQGTSNAGTNGQRHRRDRGGPVKPGQAEAPANRQGRTPRQAGPASAPTPARPPQDPVPSDRDPEPAHTGAGKGLLSRRQQTAPVAAPEPAAVADLLGRRYPEVAALIRTATLSRLDDGRLRVVVDAALAGRFRAGNTAELVTNAAVKVGFAGVDWKVRRATS